MYLFTTCITPVSEEIVKAIPVLFFAVAFSDDIIEKQKSEQRPYRDKDVGFRFDRVIGEKLRKQKIYRKGDQNE